MRTFHRKLGDLLLERRAVTTTQLEQALAVQRSTGKRLGQVLVDMGVLWEEDLVAALAHQRNEQAVELDPHATPPELLNLVPRSIAESYRVFPVGIRGDVIVLATDAQDHDFLRRNLPALLKRPVSLRWTSAADLDFAVLRAYEAGVPSDLRGDRLGQRLLRAGRITAEDLRIALRKQKRSNQKLGEVLVEMRLITPEELSEELKTP
jgi:hypothetical protein